MLIGRVRTADGVRWVNGDLEGVEDPFAALAAGRKPRVTGPRVEGEMLAATDPTVIVGIAQNGPEHRSPVQAWLKSPRTVVVSGEEVALRRDAGATVAEGEICVVIGRDTAGLTAADAHEYVLGVTAVNDLSSPDRTQWDPRNFESKSGAGYTPLAAWIDTDAGIDDVALTVAVDDAVVAGTDSGELPMTIRQCLEYVASWTPLGPGDLVMTGAPHSQAPVAPGQTVTIRVAGVELVTPLA
jgi:2-keto-4-pentenoate hydratase/2-oxohepta-3-ene-1,7-dioic acid hydratase in catechol pathway